MLKNLEETSKFLESGLKEIQVADAKEVGMGNPAEETCCYPNQNSDTSMLHPCHLGCKHNTDSKVGSNQKSGKKAKIFLAEKQQVSKRTS